VKHITDEILVIRVFV